MNYWFTSDTHYGHRNILKYTSRPFSTVEEMDQFMINQHNRLVGPNDFVFHLGDFCFGSRERKLQLIEQLNGRFFFIRGNHDEGLEAAIRSKYEIGNSKVRFFGDAFLTHVEDVQIYLLHYSCRVWPSMHRNVWHLYGHSHNNLEDHTSKDGTVLRSADVGVDTMLLPTHVKYSPYSLYELRQVMGQRGFAPLDHHKVK